MKQIKIDELLIKEVEEFNHKLFANKKSSFKSPIENLNVLVNSVNDVNQASYVQKIINEYAVLLNLKPSEFTTKKQEFDAIYEIEDIKDSASNEFGKKVVAALRYDEYRSSQYPKIINELGWNLKACYYCNYSGTLTIEKRGKYKAYYDLDHVLPKVVYPFLATTFFNFVPSCASCNRSKSSHLIHGLNPFYENKEEVFLKQKVFSISNKSEAQYYSFNDKDKITICVADRINNINKENYNKVVDLESLYNSQKHIVEEILWKKKIYSKTYINQLKKDFVELKLGEKEINRLLWGTDLDENNINDKPLAKLKYDLIKDN